MSLFLEPYRVLRQVYTNGAYLKRALSGLPRGEHGLTVRLCYSVLEHDRLLDFYLARACEKPPQSSVRLILKIGLSAYLFADMPRPFAVNEAVKLTKLLKKEGAAGYVNAVLRNLDPARYPLPEGREGLAVKSNFPAFAIDEVCAAYGERAEAILCAHSPGVSVRFRSNMEHYLALPHIDTPFENVKLFPNFVRDEGFDRGDYTFQSVGSVAVCAGVEPCERLLDACAAPGGKSALLAERCGSITACDVHPHRVRLMEGYFARLGLANTTSLCLDSARFEPRFEGAFDGVLVDAPCSGLGTVAENPDLPLRKNEGTMSELHALQTAILRNCARYVAPGGRLYYATCSILPEENDRVVDALVREGTFVAESAASPLPHTATEHGLQFLPDTAFGAGFYFARLRRI